MASKILPAILPHHIRAELFPQIYVDLDLGDATQRTAYLWGDRYEFPTLQVLAEWAQRGATAFFDVGSNFGFYSYWLCASCPDLAIYPFEPDERTYNLLTETVAGNGLDRIHPQAVGLGDAQGRLALNLGKDDTGHSTFGPHPHLHSQAPVDIEVLQFDLWRELAGLLLPETPTWIAKIDVEGFELKVLRGMERALRARAFMGLVVELNDYTLEFCGTTPQSIVAQLAEVGYQPMHARSVTLSNVFFVPSDATDPTKWLVAGI